MQAILNLEYLYIPIHTYTYLYIPIHTYTYLYIPIHTYLSTEVGFASLGLRGRSIPHRPSGDMGAVPIIMIPHDNTNNYDNNANNDNDNDTHNKHNNSNTNDETDNDSHNNNSNHMIIISTAADCGAPGSAECKL